MQQELVSGLFAEAGVTGTRCEALAPRRHPLPEDSRPVWDVSLTTRISIVVMTVAVMSWMGFTQPQGPVVLGITGCFSFAMVSLLLLERIKHDRDQIQWLEEKLTVDPLTRVLSRTGVLQFAEREIRRALRTGKPLGLLFVDLDHFKGINDAYGHPAGDEVLRVTAQRLMDSIRAYDAVGRYGGDEFVVVLPECSAHSLRDVSERLRMVGEQAIIVGSQRIQLSLSIGGISSTAKDRCLEGLLEEADRALYAAKDAGRNRYRLIDDSSERREPAPVGTPL